MRFVRKPKPYTSGPLSGFNLGGLSSPRFQRRAQSHSTQPRLSPGKAGTPRPLSQPRPTRASRTPAHWGQRSVTALAALGTVVVLLIGGSALYNQFNREAQFAAVATHLADLGR
ncbi:hypothetical protein FNU79_03595 [Deinococcus detaillensis]|uniref:Uncharacterized protein n=1 Tax=Deinococcus detaillensis TaxID=2592048 RepID=A0A553V515_9DEIO|nr:hypothetical protein [Deinococcus detaillensis]TSA87573.1 hypothetical protein FNU79_03595 [Deinococcus detaillensis]